MQDLRNMDNEKLVDLLSTYTDDYIRYSEDPTRYDDFAKCYLEIKAIQEELENRKYIDRPRIGGEPNSRVA
jgi:hypothetical protein